MSQYATRTTAPAQTRTTRESSKSRAKHTVPASNANARAQERAQRKFNAQYKLKVGSAHDPAEAEADAVAHQVVHSPQSNPAVASSGSPSTVASRISRKVNRKEEDAQMKANHHEEDVGAQDVDAQMTAPRLEEAAGAKEDEAQMQGDLQRKEDKAQMKANHHEEEVGAKEDETQMQEDLQSKEDDAQMKAHHHEEEVGAKEDEAQMQADLLGKEEEGQAKCADCDKKAQREEEIQQKSSQVNYKEGFNASQSSSDLVAQERGKGEAMAPQLKSEMESGFGTDFSDVRIHRDQKSRDLNQDLKAKAFTTGSDIFFGDGNYDPATKAGKELIAHELTHTIQQGAVDPAGQEKTSEPISSPITSKTSPTPSTGSSEPAAGGAVSEVAQEATAGIAETAPAEEVAAEGQLDSAETAEAGKEAEQKAEKGEEGKAEKEKGEGEGGGLPVANTTGSYDLDDASGRQNIVQKVSVRNSSAGERAANGGPVAQHLETESAEVCPNASATTGELADAESEHKATDEKVQESLDAEVVPETFGEAMGQQEQVGGLEGKAQSQEKVKEDPAKKELKAKLDANTPETFKDLDEYDASDTVDAVESEVTSQVSSVKGTFRGIEAAPKKKAVPTAQGLPAPEKATEVGKLQLGKDAVPGVPEEMTDLSEYDDDFNSALEKEGITQEQLDMVDKGPLVEARDERDGIREKVKTAPKEARQFADQKQKNVEQEMDKEEDSTRKDMRKERDKQLEGAKKDQEKAKDKYELERKAVTDHINGIYTGVEDKIKKRLDKLEKENEMRFGKKVLQFSNEFEKQVKKDVNAYLDERHSGIGGFFLSGWDWLTGIDDHPQVERAFERARADYIKKIDQEIKDIATETNSVIDECKQWLEDAKQEIKDYVDDLPGHLAQHGQDAAKDMDKKFTELDKFIDKKKEELVAKLCQMKEKAIEHIDAKIEKMKEEMAGAIAKALMFLIDAALSFFTWALETVGYDMGKIRPQIAKTRRTLKEIVMHPIAFMGNLIDAAGQGFSQFGDNIRQHMISGLVNWLTGTMGDIDIELPQTWDLKGFLFFFLQTLGLSWNVLRQKLTRYIPEHVISFAEGSVDMVRRVIKEGPIALWDEFKAKMGEIKGQIMESVRNMLVVELVKKGIEHLLGILVPGAGIVKAIIAIYDIIMFFIENWQRIVELVMTIFKSVGDIAFGKIGKAANFIENAMGMTIPIMFAFLARLLRLGGLAKKVQKAIKKVRKPIDKIVDKVLKKIAKTARKLFGRKKGKGGKKDKDQKDGLTAADRRKHKQYVTHIKKELHKKSADKKDSFEDFYKKKKKLAGSLEKKYNKKLKKKVNGRPIRATIKFEPLKGADKDNDVDVKIRIAPNATEDETGLVFTEEEVAEHIQLMDDGKKSVDEREKIYQSFTNTIGSSDVVKSIFEARKTGPIKGKSFLKQIQKAIGDNAQGGFKFRTQGSKKKLELTLHYKGFFKSGTNPAYGNVQREINSGNPLGEAWVISRTLKTDFFVPREIKALNIRGVGKTMMEMSHTFFKDEIDGIGGDWMELEIYRRGATGSVKSDNLLKYIEGIRAGESPKKAATRTWTYRRAKALGYPVVEFVDQDPSSTSDPDAISNVSARFVKS